MKIFKRTAAIVLALCLVVGVFAACKSVQQPSQEELLVGTWRDSVGIAGYEFGDTNTCKITYVDFVVPFINSNFSGNLYGAYQLSKDEDNNNYININYTCFGRTIVEKFQFSVDGDVLTLVNAESGKQTVYMRVTPAAQTTPAA